MDLGWKDYHDLNVILLSAIGLWPYGNTLVLQLKRFIGSFFCVYACFGQLATFITVDYNKSLFLKNIPGIFVGCCLLLKYISFLAASDSIKKVTETINDDWKNLSNKEEIRIVEKYVERSKFYTKGFALLISPTALYLILVPVYPVVLDVVMPLNGSRNRNFPIMLEAFLDQQKYFFVATFLFEGVIVTGGLVFVTTEALLIVYVQHACVLYEATSRRIKELSYSTQTKKPKSINTESIAQVVEIHTRAIRSKHTWVGLLYYRSFYWKIATCYFNGRYTYSHRYCNLIKEEFFPSYLLLIVFGVMSLAAYVFRCTQTLESNEYTEFLTSAAFSFAILGYIFYVIAVMQHLLNLSCDIFDVLYSIEWYTFPTSTQKLVLFCMLKSMKPVAVDIHNLFYLSFEGFCMMMRMVMSYITALYSIQ